MIAYITYHMYSKVIKIIHRINDTIIDTIKLLNSSGLKKSARNCSVFVSTHTQLIQVHVKENLCTDMKTMFK